MDTIFDRTSRITSKLVTLTSGEFDRRSSQLSKILLLLSGILKKTRESSVNGMPEI